MQADLMDQMDLITDNLYPTLGLDIATWDDATVIALQDVMAQQVANGREVPAKLDEATAECIRRGLTANLTVAVAYPPAGEDREILRVVLTRGAFKGIKECILTLEVSGGRYVVSTSVVEWVGRVGHPEWERRRSFGRPDEARKRANELFESLVAKGYQRVA